MLPDLALLRLVVFDSDHVFIGQRVLPVNHLRAGFRHVSLRDKHNYPLGLANLFLHIKIEDYIPDEYGGIIILIFLSHVVENFLANYYVSLLYCSVFQLFTTLIKVKLSIGNKNSLTKVIQ